MEKIIYKQRRGTDSTKWDGCGERFGRADLLPLWVADMDFEVPLCVKEALKKYVDFGVTGYYRPPEAYKEAFIVWERKYHGYQVEKEWICFAPGIVPAINWWVHILTREQDSVMIMPPVYYPFKDAIVNNHRKLVESPLICDRDAHRYVMDYEDFEQKVMAEHVKLFIFCSPHNPVGRVWTVQETKRILDICKKHQVYVLADEIHQDILMKGSRYVAAAATGEYDSILVTLTAATKTFNLAACQNALVVVPDERLRALYEEYLTRLRMHAGNPFGYIAVQSAYEGGREWLLSVLETVEDNYWFLRRTLEEALPDVWISDLEGTYLMWIDLGRYVAPGKMEYIMEEICGLAADYGTWFGEKGYEGFIRINLATDRTNIETAAKKLISALG